MMHGQQLGYFNEQLLHPTQLYIPLLTLTHRPKQKPLPSRADFPSCAKSVTPVVPAWNTTSFRHKFSCNSWEWF